MSKPVLVFGYGNLSRGDDALGPLLLEFIEAKFDLTSIEILTDFQLQIEHALDMENRSLVLFVDASVSCREAFDFARLQPAMDKSYTTHAMSPSALMQVYRQINKQSPPPCFLLSIKAENMELGEGLSPQALIHLNQACQFVGGMMHNLSLDFWIRQADEMRQIGCERLYACS